MWECKELGELTHSLSDTTDQENSIFENKLINFADNNNSSTNDNPSSPPNYISTRYPFPLMREEGESIQDSDSVRERSIDFTDVRIPDHVYQDNRLHGAEEKLDYFNVLNRRIESVMRELGFTESHIKNFSVQNEITTHRLGQILEMRNHKYAVIFFCDSSTSKFREIHVDSYTQSYPDNRTLIMGSPYMVPKIPINSLILDNENMSREELEEMRANQDIARNTLWEKVVNRRDGYFQYLLSTHRDSTRLGMLNANLGYDGVDRTEMLLREIPPVYEAHSDQERLYNTALEAYKREFSTMKFLNAMDQNPVSESSFVCKEIRKSLEKDLHACSTTKNVALQRLEQIS